ncbi:MAG: hypothetical protein K2X74_22230, partial [Acetobacteraceae bacterium]|nr:hypothetical protein [Acetobacteraceae bacterium]
PPVELATMLALQDAAEAGQPMPDAAAIARGMLVKGSSDETIAWTEEMVTRSLTERLPALRRLGVGLG